MTDYIGIHLIDLPHTVRGYTLLNSDGSYTIIINARLSAETQIAVYEHEMAHIDNGDFSLSGEFADSVDELEYERHAG
ncbi:MAG: hypothetical protein HFG67_00130 [Firmicutes bacterium]|nr:hypothetical protein [Bacillota bacterium]